MSEPPPLIELRGVERRRGEGFFLRIENIAVTSKSRIAIVGPSGSGKSTCLDLIAMSLRPDNTDLMTFHPLGKQLIDVGALWSREDRKRIRALRARHFGYVLQTGGLVPFLSLQENAMLSRRLLGKPGEGPVGELFESLGIGSLRLRKPRKVSIGERQRAAVVRALAHEPDIVLADEPTASLDRATAEEVMAQLTQTVADRGAALILVTHDEVLAKDFALTIVRCQINVGGRQSTIRMALT